MTKKNQKLHVWVFPWDLLTPVKYRPTPDSSFIFVAITHTTYRHFALIAVVGLNLSCYYRRSQRFDTSTLKTQANTDFHWFQLPHLYFVYLLLSVCDPCTLQQLKLRVCVCVLGCVFECVFECLLNLKAKTKKAEVVLIWKLKRVQTDAEVCLVTLCNNTILTLPFSLSGIQWKE